MNLTKTLFTNLQNLYTTTGNEKGGYITSDFQIVECQNCHIEPENNFTYNFEAMDKLETEGWATFHTHVDKSSNLSKEDYDSFQNYYDLIHFIIGNDGISCYKVTDRGTVVKEPIILED